MKCLMIITILFISDAYAYGSVKDKDCGPNGKAYPWNTIEIDYCSGQTYKAPFTNARKERISFCGCEPGFKMTDDGDCVKRCPSNNLRDSNGCAAGQTWYKKCTAPSFAPHGIHFCNGETIMAKRACDPELQNETCCFKPVCDCLPGYLPMDMRSNVCRQRKYCLPYMWRRFRIY